MATPGSPYEHGVYEAYHGTMTAEAIARVKELGYHEGTPEYDQFFDGYWAEMHLSHEENEDGQTSS